MPSKSLGVRHASFCFFFEFAEVPKLGNAEQFAFEVLGLLLKAWSIIRMCFGLGSRLVAFVQILSALPSRMGVLELSEA